MQFCNSYCASNSDTYRQKYLYFWLIIDTKFPVKFATQRILNFHRITIFCEGPLETRLLSQLFYVATFAYSKNACHNNPQHSHQFFTESVNKLLREKNMHASSICSPLCRSFSDEASPETKSKLLGEAFPQTNVF